MLVLSSSITLLLAHQRNNCINNKILPYAKLIDESFKMKSTRLITLVNKF